MRTPMQQRQEAKEAELTDEELSERADRRPK
jgi:hypothetical protein